MSWTSTYFHEFTNFNLTKSIRIKGQLISKELFAILEFFQKTNETIQS